ncbi:GHKL domain protein [Leptospira kirschneri str. MMD1493]|nr:GHKL domain protein [Leptospira kirschneri str. MMD1493]
MGSTIVTIEDNGKGIPKEMINKNHETLGLQLVNILTKQIQGKLHLEILDPGTKFENRFPEQKGAVEKKL